MKLPDILEQFRTLKVLVVGDLMLDHYVIGGAMRLSPEAPVPVIHAERETYSAGGAANVALNLAGLGAETWLFGVIGEDEAGGRLEQIAGACGVRFHPERRAIAPTILKSRVVAYGQQVCRIDHEGQRCLYTVDAREPQVRAFLEQTVPAMDAVIISDYAKGVISQELLDAVVELAGPSGTLVAADPKPGRRLCYKGTHLLTPNRSEALKLAGIEEDLLDAASAMETLCAHIYDRHAPALLAVTLGADGILVSEKGQFSGHLRPCVKEVFDVSGAGDTVIATLTCALAAGADPLSAAHLANVAAGVVVAQFGTAAISRNAFAAALEDERLFPEPAAGHHAPDVGRRRAIPV